MKKLLAAAFFIAFFSGIAFADTAIKAEVDKTKVSTDDTLTYKLVITTSEKDIPEPKIPAFTGFVILSQAQSSTLIFKEKTPRAFLVYTFILTPVSVGKIAIEPARIMAAGKAYSSEKFQIEVTQGKKPLQPPENPNLPGSDQPKVTL